MTRLLTIGEVLQLHRMVMDQTGGAVGVRDLGALESAVAQPQATFGGEPLYPEVIDKAAALAFFVVRNHPFVDGNKRTGHAAMDVMLTINGYHLVAPVSEQEATFLSLAAGSLGRDVFTQWVRSHAEQGSA